MAARLPHAAHRVPRKSWPQSSGPAPETGRHRLKRASCCRSRFPDGRERRRHRPRQAKAPTNPPPAPENARRPRPPASAVPVCVAGMASGSRGFRLPGSKTPEAERTARAPTRLHVATRDDRRETIHGGTAAEVEGRRKPFQKKRQTKCKAIADSLAEAGAACSLSFASTPSDGRRRPPPTPPSAFAGVPPPIEAQPALPCAETVPTPRWTLPASGRAPMRNSEAGNPCPLQPGSATPLPAD